MKRCCIQHVAHASQGLSLLTMQHKPIIPNAGQESVWNYPRPPRVEAASKHIKIIFNGKLIVDTHRARRVLETSHPPNYYIALDNVATEYLIPTSHATFCEWKGTASYYTLKVGDREAKNAAWYYPNISPDYKALEGYVSFYPGLMDACYVDDEKVKPQAGGFYAGWITQDIVGPFKGEAGTLGW